MEIISFGTYRDPHKFKVLDERKMRASAGIMFLVGLFGFINGFILDRYSVLPYVSGFLLINFLIGIFINPKFSPTIFLGSLLVKGQTPIYVGAVQKKFAWSMGTMLASAIFILSLFLLQDVKYFEPLCLLCIICLTLIYLELAFGICVGCWIYKLLLRIKILPEPKERPNCTGDVC